ncbi:exotoxin beta-grasp domain-containing protein [Staphylococcus intermedius]|uniref:exotoxin beta-grasp domain-containing protein n=1 Tax=Staphylococcus intermedius TaxID=1285 RepID=UPI000BBB8001|nr:exotoxin beta-grasp domain-containing protein [Staphylococcus intermedius]PCF86178.1 exotoxin [Staphylococcus intermedius]
MKQSTILKVSLAVGILTTGVGIQSHTAAFANTDGIQITNPQTKELKEYYSKHYFEYHNLNGYVEGDKKLSVVTPESTSLLISLLGKDASIYNDDKKTYENLDLFVVPEGTDRSAQIKSIGGITKTNKSKYYDDVKRPNIEINRNSGELSSRIDTNELSIDKEEVSLKELDFKLRQMLINKYDLYKNGSSNGKIVIKIGDEDKDIMTLELDKKLQPHRMSDTVNAKQIQQITIDL